MGSNPTLSAITFPFLFIDLQTRSNFVYLPYTRAPINSIATTSDVHWTPVGDGKDCGTPISWLKTWVRNKIRTQRLLQHGEVVSIHVAGSSTSIRFAAADFNSEVPIKKSDPFH